ncbi:MAG: hypothetical protein KGO51_15325 [Alphaproteobacteria bacterium]|nr:hypothetical protein [Alphaproteobacteria bacterium]
MKKIILLGAVATAMTLTSAAAAFADPYDHRERSYHREHDGWRGGEHRGWNRDGDHRRWRGDDDRRDRDGRRDRYEARSSSYGYDTPYTNGYGYAQPYAYSYSYPY